LIRVLALLVNPFLPRTSKKIYSFLGLDIQVESWEYPEPKKAQEIVQVMPLYHKIEDAEIEKQISKLVKHVQARFKPEVQHLSSQRIPHTESSSQASSVDES